MLLSEVLLSKLQLRRVRSPVELGIRCRNGQPQPLHLQIWESYLHPSSWVLWCGGGVSLTGRNRVPAEADQSGIRESSDWTRGGFSRIWCGLSDVASDLMRWRMWYVGSGGGSGGSGGSGGGD
ncbi:OLC1v1013080C1 [Oldenlandia corymbosa var. corymbosa]|uniref:OLC1v1013080C1 n=1 Tax=Oldenlandia corymbosa var. corymbosa TaxID=529605 RepID=A0AAV1DZW5_OLDCO|nr:OLC1v1013080C1 [Oldenlandia corymbosa var. corymbosa]